MTLSFAMAPLAFSQTRTGPFVAGPVRELERLLAVHHVASALRLDPHDLERGERHAE